MRAVLLNPESNPNDGRWLIWAKILCEYQQNDIADPANDLTGFESLWQLRMKVLKAIINTS